MSLAANTYTTPTSLKAVSPQTALSPSHSDNDDEAIEFDPATGEVQLGGERVVLLSRQQSKLFVILAESYPKPITKRNALNLMYSEDTETGDKTIDIHLCRTRKKLNAAGITNLIAARWGGWVVLTRPVSLPNGFRRTTTNVKFSLTAMNALRELLERCIERPADAPLVDQVWRVLEGHV